MGRKKVRVIASGVFDLLHYGHVKFLERAKELAGEGGELVVVIARDSTVRKLKGKEPILREEERRYIVGSLKPVDQAILGHEGLDIPGIIEEYRPDIIAVGHDQAEIERLVKKYIESKGYPIEVVRLEKYGISDIDSSSKIRSKVSSSLNQ